MVIRDVVSGCDLTMQLVLAVLQAQEDKIVCVCVFEGYNKNKKKLKSNLWKWLCPRTTGCMNLLPVFKGKVNLGAPVELRCLPPVTWLNEQCCKLSFQSLGCYSTGHQEKTHSDHCWTTGFGPIDFSTHGQLTEGRDHSHRWKSSSILGFRRLSS